MRNGRLCRAPGLLAVLANLAAAPAAHAFTSSHITTPADPPFPGVEPNPSVPPTRKVRLSR